MTQEKVAQQPAPPAAVQKWLTCNGQQLRKMVYAGLAWLERNHQEVNALNVFPVPDGDTGTNMLLTMRAAYNRVKDDRETMEVGEIAHEVSQGALMGARGNSGVILSQIWRGLAKSLKDKHVFDTDDLAAAFQGASETAYKGVMRPVEGTILTVIREGAEEAEDAAGKSKDLRFLLERVVERCQQALARTPELLPVLKQAGVVDAGGQGLVVILDGMLRYVHGEPVETTLVPEAASAPAQARVAPAAGLEYPYDVQFILSGRDLSVPAVREAIGTMGDSTLVVGDEKTIKVHVHVKDPGKPISYGANLGSITDVVVENMQLQMETIVSGASPIPATVAFPEATVTLKPGQIGVVSVAAGNGLAEIFRSLGACGIVNGGQSNNPSTEEIYRAVQDTPTDKVIILPNNKNIILAAEAARDLSPKRVAVVPTRTAPQGISAMLSHNPDGDFDQVVSAMEAAKEQVASGEIAVAIKSVLLDGVAVEEGQTIGVADGRLCVAGHGLNSVLPELLDKMKVADRELVSIYYGQDVTESDANSLAEWIWELYPDLELEILRGGQAIYHYILGAE